MPKPPQDSEQPSARVWDGIVAAIITPDLLIAIRTGKRPRRARTSPPKSTPK